jgi:hypothetical protein
MSGTERMVAALLLAVAVTGGALIPRLLSAPAGPVGVGLAVGPGVAGGSVVQAPAIPNASHRTVTRSTPRPQGASPASLLQPIATNPPAGGGATPPSEPAHHPSAPPPSSPPPPSPPPPSPPPSSPPPPSTPPPSPPPTSPPPTSPPPAAQTPPTRPGHGYGDKNHVHTGPPGHQGHPSSQVKPARRSHGADLEGSGHGRKAPQAPSHAVGHHHRPVGHMAAPASGSTAHGHESRPKTRPEARGPRGKGGHGSAPPPVAPGHGSQSSPPPPTPPPPPPAPGAPPPPPAHGNNGQGNTHQGQGHQGQGHGKGQS